MKIALASAASIIFLLNLSCSKSNGSKASGPVSVPLNVVTSAEGVSEATYDSTSASDQTISITSVGQATSGLEVLMKPGTLALPTQIFVEEGTSPSSAVVRSLSLPETPLLQSAPVVIRPADVSIIPAQPLTVSLPLSVGVGLTADPLLIVLYVGWTKDGQKAGIISPDQITILNGKAVFKSAYFGSFQLAKISVLPTVKEAASAVKISSKIEAARAQALYFAGAKAGRAGYFKDSVWG